MSAAVATPNDRAYLAAIELKARREARRSLLPYTRFTLPQYDAQWYHEIIAYVLDLVERGVISRVIITAPPRHGKTELVSVRFPAYYLGKHPQRAVISTSYAIELARTNSRASRETVKGEHHQRLFPSRMGVDSDTHWQVEQQRGLDDRGAPIYVKKNDGRNSFICAGAGGGITGEGAHLLIIDDPFKNYEEALSFVTRESRWNWFTTTARTRLMPNAAIVIIMTRWHEDDLAGRCLRRASEDSKADQWLVLELPSYNDGANFNARCWSTTGVIPDAVQLPHGERVIVNNRVEYRFHQYDALWPRAYDRAFLDSSLATMGSRQFAALFGGSPRLADGNIIKRSWFRRWWIPTNYTELTGNPMPTDGTGLLPGYAFESCEVLPEMSEFDMICQSWDLTFKDTKTSDFVAGHVYARRGSFKYLLDRVNARMNFPETKRAIKQMSSKWPQAHAKYIEDKANGPAIIDDLRGTVDGLIPVEPIGSKDARLSAAAPAAEAGDVVLPHPSIAPWVYDVIEQLTGYGSLPHDDDCDAYSQAIYKMRNANYGLITYIKEETGRRDAEKLMHLAKISSPQSTKITVNDATDACPECGDKTVQRISGQKRCGACGHQWGNSAIVLKAPARSELSGATRASGFTDRGRPR